ncbi:hypothetical protein LLG96_06990, partial [bacterium]|nr:hypothetical protein [bacterium]
FNTMINVKDITFHGSYPALDLSLGIPGYQGGTMISNPGPGKLFGFAVYIRDNVTTRGFTLTFRWDKTKAEFRKSQSGAEISDDTITINGITDLTLASEKNMLVSDGTGSLTSVGERYEDGFYTVSWAKMGGDAITAPEGLLYLAVFRTASDLSENDYFPVLVEVSVSDETGNVQSLKPAEFFIGSPVYPPTVITVKDIPDDNGHSAALSWNLSPDDPNVMHYSIYRSRHPEISDPIPLASFKTVAELAEAEKTHMILIASVPNGVNSFLDTAIPVSGVHYYYWLQAVTQSGASEKIAALPLGSVTSVEELPAAFRVFPPCPNPFNPVTLIRYEIPTGCKISLAVYDILGRKAALLVDGYIPAGLHEALWNGRDDSGRSMSSGVYFYRFEAGKEYVSQGKMLLLR